jgi:hypothetical protein
MPHQVLASPPPPAEKSTARKYQAGQTSTGDGARNPDGVRARVKTQVIDYREKVNVRSRAVT